MLTCLGNLMKMAHGNIWKLNSWLCGNTNEGEGSFKHGAVDKHTLYTQIEKCFLKNYLKTICARPQICVL